MLLLVLGSYPRRAVARGASLSARRPRYHRSPRWLAPTGFCTNSCPKLARTLGSPLSSTTASIRARNSSRKRLTATADSARAATSGRESCTTTTHKKLGGFVHPRRAQSHQYCAPHIEGDQWLLPEFGQEFDGPRIVTLGQRIASNDWSFRRPQFRRQLATDCARRALQMQNELS